jgi:hypothetical protein
MKTSDKSTSEEESTSVSISSSEEPLTTPASDGTYFHVTFLNYDDSLLYEVDVLDGEAAIYQGTTPIKPEDDEFTYEFIGWDKDLNSINSDTIAKAQFEAIAKENWGSISWF